MKNLKKTKNAQVQAAVPVPAGRKGGQPVKLGTAGLRGICVTDRCEADTEFGSGGAVGLKVGEATVELIGVHLVIKVPFAGAVPRFTGVFMAPDGTYTTDSNNGANTQFGATINELTGAGVAEVAIF